MGRLKVVALVALAALVGVLAACSGDDSSANVTSLPATAASPPGQLVDRECDTPSTIGSAKCYWLEVPERRDEPGPRTIKLWVAVVTPPDALPAALPVVSLSGGPGDPDSRGALSRESRLLGVRRPVVFVDQRGTGLSEPRLDCDALASLPDGTHAWTDRVATARAAAKTCRDALVASGVELDGYNTAEDTADIVALRKALGFDKWLVYGLSYGGRLAQQVLEADESGIAGVILDSSITSEPLGPASLVERAKDAVVRLSSACAAQPACAANTPDLDATLAAAVARLDAAPYTTTVKDADGRAIVVSGQEVLSGAFNAQYDQALIAVLPGAAKSIAEGQTDIIDPLAAQLSVDDDAARGLFGTSLCADDFADPSPADRAVVADPGEYGTLLLGWPYAMCDAWDVAPVPGGPLTEPISDVPVLLMEGGLDPVAPPRFADTIKAGLSHATVVVIPAGGHGNAFGSDCATSISIAFLDNPQAPVDTSCVASLPQPLAP